MRNDLLHLFSNEKASLGILSADRNFVRIISENIPRVNMCREELDFLLLHENEIAEFKEANNQYYF